VIAAWLQRGGAWVVALALLALAAGWVVGKVEAYGDQRYLQGAADKQAVWDADKLRVARQSQQLAAARAAETERRLGAQKEVMDAQAQELARMRLDLRSSADERERLRQQQSATVSAARGAIARCAAPGSDGPAAAAAIDLLAELRDRADDAAGELAAALDLAHTAGTACERLYGTVTAQH
jgi:hypothetical protein